MATSEVASPPDPSISSPLTEASNPNFRGHATPEEQNAAVQGLTDGFLGIFDTPLQNINRKLAELQRSQEALAATIAAESNRLENLSDFKEVLETLAKINVYRQKIYQIRQSMQSISDRTAKLKRRAQKLQEWKQKEEMVAADRRNRELERDRQLAARPAESMIVASSSDKPESSPVSRKIVNPPPAEEYPAATLAPSVSGVSTSDSAASPQAQPASLSSATSKMTAGVQAASQAASSWFSSVASGTKSAIASSAKSGLFKKKDAAPKPDTTPAAVVNIPEPAGPRT
eukprot:TRINITY_DN15010_c0_g1_i1.p1 TRINITY_DN15010_c0_g1~~TRINITY_DN15010_c0_g1_i1.p1  ORF type:complete len:296 (-),score=80.93 TRINITY_DN15010_c0_g1_i1:348-1208(-)